MARTFKCQCNKGTCYIPDPTVVVRRGRVSVVSRGLLSQLSLPLDGMVPARPVRFTLSADILKGLSRLAPDVARAFRTTSLFAQREPSPRDNGVIVLCTPCGHTWIV